MTNCSAKMLPWGLLTFVTVVSSLTIVVDTSVDLDTEDYEMLANNEEKSDDNDSPFVQEVRCYCNQPKCVPQGYMCRGKGCFTELPSNANPSVVRAEHSTYSGCLGESFKKRLCPRGYLCCEQDLCNHVDNPAMRNRLNKTFQVLPNDQRPFLETVQPINHGGQSTDGWFKTATIAVPICGLIVLLMLASLAIRLLQPMPTQSDKLGLHQILDNGPPLLSPPKVPLV